MPKKRFSVEQVISHLREAEVFLAQGQTIGQVCRHIGISEQSYYRWHREYGGLKVDQARRLKEFGFSERQACRYLGQPCSTERRRRIVLDEEETLTAAISRLADEYGRPICFDDEYFPFAYRKYKIED